MMRTTLELLTGRTMGDPTCPLSRAAIVAWQAERLRRQVAYCREHAPFYRRKLAEAGVEAIRGIEDLTRLPMTTEAELRQFGPEMVCVSQDQVARIVTLHSSGTTGAPKRLWFTDADLEQTLAFFHLGMQHLVGPGQRVAILLPGATPDSTGHLLVQALGRMQVEGRILGLVSEPETTARLLARYQPDALVGFPVQILAVARQAASLRLDLGSIRSVLLCSDYIAASVRRSLADLLGCEIFTHYGTTETGLGGGVDCAAHCGSHLREADLLFEIIDPKSGAALPDGRWGEIVCTTLTRTGMPLLRFRTGDQGRLLPGSCPCGSHIRRLDQVLGRREQVRLLPNGNPLAMPDLDEWLLPMHGLLDFKACLVREHGQDTLHLTLTALPGRGQEISNQAAEILADQAALQGVALAFALTASTAIHPGKRLLEDHREDNAS